ncbi:hypothetical protein CYLTODRAFT_144494 [Cylindrobasidium torrendii FP15055 ss-10]|uniref:YTH domain-containing protein n=1 Tax=Cylindrobasidium torrendii FP15055 ss-10 TaxID=1314674 RepID=A0A0D7BKY7_9AGAR|nr:hypothetical protein CYLTODRAFT_144494 [Cylindrobasidium torrendii FP15055 ss-10]
MVESSAQVQTDDLNNFPTSSSTTPRPKDATPGHSDPHSRGILLAYHGGASSYRPVEQELDLETLRNAIDAVDDSMPGGAHRDGAEQRRPARRGFDSSQNSSGRHPGNTHPTSNSSHYPPGQSFAGHYNAGAIPSQSSYQYVSGYEGHPMQGVAGYQTTVYSPFYPTGAPMESNTQSFPALYNASSQGNTVQSPQPQPHGPTPSYQVMSFSPPPPSQYSYPQPFAQPYPASPVYQNQYGYVQASGMYSPHERDGQQMSWWYPQAPASPRPFSPGTPFQTPYHAPFSPPPGVRMDGFPPPGAISPSSSHMPSSASITPPDGIQASSSSSSVAPDPKSGSTKPHQGRQVLRRPYHPNPPSHRSEWVMWVGNVPNDATHDELWRFFTESDGSQTTNGVVSIFLISRSNCAFVNYDSDATLQRGIAHFNGLQLRPSDSRCPRLVCRVRQKEDDLKAGVGGQRGMGMHMKWVKQQQKEKEQIEASDSSDAPPTSPSASSRRSIQSVLSDDDSANPRPPAKSSSSGSFGSTTSSVLTRYFPKRYFILKSLTQYDLDLSLQTGLWATQKHNEGILDQAFRTSKEVYLIFGVNKSGEFYGYAKMTGPVFGEPKVPWASRDSSSVSPSTGRLPVQKDAIEEDASQPKAFFSNVEHRMVEQSPQPLSAHDSRRFTPSAIIPKVQSAPAEPRLGHSKMTPQSPDVKYSLDTRMWRPELAASKTQPQALAPTTSSEDFQLDETAPFRAVKHDSGSARENEDEDEKSKVNDNEDPNGHDDDETWGESFRVEWLCTERLPFHRTRHIRNPWNKDREVKVSRDGTELEPIIGQQLIDEWSKLAEPRPSAPPTDRKTTGKKKQQQHTQPGQTFTTTSRS